MSTSVKRMTALRNKIQSGKHLCSKASENPARTAIPDQNRYVLLTCVRAETPTFFLICSSCKTTKNKGDQLVLQLSFHGLKCHAHRNWPPHPTSDHQCGWVTQRTETWQAQAEELYWARVAGDCSESAEKRSLGLCFTHVWNATYRTWMAWKLESLWSRREIWISLKSSLLGLALYARTASNSSNPPQKQNKPENATSQHSNSQAASQPLWGMKGSGTTICNLPRRVRLGYLNSFLKVQALSLLWNSRRSDNKHNSGGWLKGFHQKSWKFSTLPSSSCSPSRILPWETIKEETKCRFFQLKHFISGQAPFPGSCRRATGLCPHNKSTQPAKHPRLYCLRRPVGPGKFALTHTHHHRSISRKKKEIFHRKNQIAKINRSVHIKHKEQVLQTCSSRTLDFEIYCTFILFYF